MFKYIQLLLDAPTLYKLLLIRNIINVKEQKMDQFKPRYFRTGMFHSNYAELFRGYPL